MASIPLPALHVNPPEQPNLLQQYGQALQMRSLLGQQQLQQASLQHENLENQQAQMSLDDQKKIRQAFMDSKGDIDQTIDSASKLGVDPKTLFAMKQQSLQQKQSLATLSKDQLANHKALVDMTEASAQKVLTAAPQDRPAVYAAERQSLVSTGMVKPEELPENYPGEEFVRLHATAALGAKKQIADAEEAQTKAATQAIEQQQKSLVLAGTNSKGVTADQQAQLSQGAQRIAGEAAGRAETARHNKATEGQLTPEALDMAARQFATTGEMPNVGRDGAARKAIINEAARLYPQGVDLASNAAAYKANKDSLTKLQGSFDAVQAFEKTANKNLDLAVETAQKLGNKNSPILNKPMNAIRRDLLGSEDQAAYDVALRVATNEIAKVTSSPGLSGQLTDSARHEVESAMSPNATVGQILSTAKVLKQDMANRHQAYQEQVDAISGRIKQKPGSSGSPQQAPAASGNFDWNSHPKAQ